MPDLGKAYVQIVPSAEGISGSITKAIGGEATNAGAAGGKAMMGSMLKVVGTAGAAAAVAKTLYSGIKAAVGEYADYEQLTGGVETLFKDSADTVMRYAENAYKTAGLSANEYMETVTSFSASLLQSLGGDTAAAAGKADMAITDMADNANKMGTAMESIQNAYQGFAKQNYTMLDNLKLGYGGTKEEMERLLEDAEKLSGIHYDISSYADIVDAIHVIQDEMGITGTTAKEASETISGSISSARAAIDNLLTGLGDADADLIGLMDDAGQSVLTAAGNVAEAVGTVITAPIRAIAQATDPMNQMVSEAERHASRLNDSITAASETGSVDGLVSQYQELTAKTQDASISADELAIAEAQLSGITDQLRQRYPDLLGQIEAGTDAWDLQLKAIQATAEAQRLAAMAELTNNAAFMVDDLLELKNAAEDAQNEVGLLESEMSAGMDIDVDAAVTHIKELKDELQGKIEAGEIEFDDQEYLDGIDELRKALGELTSDPVNIEGLSDVDQYLQMLASGAITASYDVEEMSGKLASAYSTAAEASAALSSGQVVFQSLLNSGLMTLDTLREVSGHAGLALSDLGITSEDVGRLVATGAITANEAMERYGMSQEGVNRAVTAYQNAAREAAGASEGVAEELNEEAEAAQAAHDALLGISVDARDALSSGEDLREEYNRLEKEFDQVKDSGDDTAVMLAQQRLTMLNLAATNQELVKGLNGIPGAMQYAKIETGELSAMLINAGYSADDYVNAVTSMRDGVVNSFHVLVDESSITADEMGEALASNKATMIQWQQDLQDLWWAAYADQDTVTMQYISHLASLGPAYASAAHEFVAGGYEELQTQAQDYAEIGELSAEMAADGMAANAYLAGDSGTSITDAALENMEAADFTTPGGEAVSDWAAGATGKSYAAANAAQSVISGAQSAADSKTGDFWYVGWNMDLGVIRGINDGSGRIEAAARAAALRAFKAAKEALDINSPSKLFRDDIGKAIPEGLALGIEQNADIVRRSMKGLSEMTAGEYRVREMSLDKYSSGSLMMPSTYGGSYSNVVNVAVNGAESPEEYANRLARQLQMQMRMV